VGSNGLPFALSSVGLLRFFGLRSFFCIPRGSLCRLRRWFLANVPFDFNQHVIQFLHEAPTAGDGFPQVGKIVVLGQRHFASISNQIPISIGQGLMTR
jgi:hypothetical protein